MVIQRLKVDLIIADRVPVGRRTFEIAIHLEKGGTVPPIHVVPYKSGCWFVLNGRHRLAAHKLVGKKQILAKHAGRRVNESHSKD